MIIDELDNIKKSKVVYLDSTKFIPAGPLSDDTCLLKIIYIFDSQQSLREKEQNEHYNIPNLPNTPNINSDNLCTTTKCIKRATYIDITNELVK
jgi:hypothetical protein